MPFWCSWSGGTHEMAAEVALMAITVTLIGGWLGSRKRKKIQCNLTPSVYVQKNCCTLCRKGSGHLVTVEPRIKDPQRTIQPLTKDTSSISIVIEDSFFTMNTMVGPKVSFAQRFHCKTQHRKLSVLCKKIFALHSRGFARHSRGFVSGSRSLVSAR